jgi:hypothetical protein
VAEQQDLDVLGPIGRTGATVEIDQPAEHQIAQSEEHGSGLLE